MFIISSNLQFRSKIVNIKGIKSRNLETQRMAAIRREQAGAITNWRERYEKIKENARESKKEVKRAPIYR